MTRVYKSNHALLLINTHLITYLYIYCHVWCLLFYIYCALFIWTAHIDCSLMEKYHYIKCWVASSHVWVKYGFFNPTVGLYVKLFKGLSIFDPIMGWSTSAFYSVGVSWYVVMVKHDVFTHSTCLSRIYHCNRMFSQSIPWYMCLYVFCTIWH